MLFLVLLGDNETHFYSDSMTTGLTGGREKAVVIMVRMCSY